MLKAEVAIVKIGHLEFEGLMLVEPEKLFPRFAVSIPQANDLLEFSPSKNTASRDLNRILGEAFSPSKVKVKGSRQVLNWTEDELLGLNDKKTYWRNYRRASRSGQN